MLTRNHIEWHPGKDLEVLNIHKPMCPFHGHTLVIPDCGWARTNFFLLLFLTWQSLPFRRRGRDLFNWHSWRSCPYILNPRNDRSGVCNWSNGRTFPVTRAPFFPIFDKGSSFLDLIFAYISLLNLVIISTRKKHLKKKGRKKKDPSTHEKINTDEVNTYIFFPQCRCCARRREMGHGLGNRMQAFADLQGPPNF